MNLQELKEKFLGKVRGDGEQTRRADGGTSCYRPNRRRSREEQMPEAYTQDSAQIPYIHTGFTGMNPPQGMEATGYAQNDPYNSVQYSGWGPTAPQEASRGYNQGYTNEERAAYRDNISYMPGAGAPEGAPVHQIQRIMTLTGLKNCYEAIECMKNGEALILTMDAIANDGEITRCQDMLAGAAFTLGCTVRSLPAPRMILVVPQGVQVLPDENRYSSNAPMAPMAPAMPPMMSPAAPAQAQQPAPRQRRSSQNTQNWQAFAATGTDNNGYMPRQTAKPSEYANYGGYGF